MKYLFILVFVLFAGCGTTTTGDDNDGIMDPYADPPDYSGDPFAGFDQITSIEFPATLDGEIEEIATEEAEVASGGAWSVQVAACGSMDAALALRDVVAEETGQSAFIDHEGSYYKVRVGSFETSLATDVLRQQLRSAGYSGAWSVQR